MKLICVTECLKMRLNSNNFSKSICMIIGIFWLSTVERIRYDKNHLCIKTYLCLRNHRSLYRLRLPSLLNRNEKPNKIVSKIYKHFFKKTLSR